MPLQIGVSVKKDEKDRIFEAAARARRSVSEFIRLIVLDRIREDNPPTSPQINIVSGKKIKSI